jgi:alanine racemase
VTRATRIVCDATALLHNLNRVRQCAPAQTTIAIVKANAYGCGIETIVPELEGRVDAFGVASFEEAQAIRHLGSATDCLLLQGVFSAAELPLAAALRFQCVIHHHQQLEWLLNTPLMSPLTVWVKVNTGMHRLGFSLAEVVDVLAAVRACAWVAPTVGLMTHFACADEPGHLSNAVQLQQFNRINVSSLHVRRSLANSAAILTMPESHADVVRPGIMLYGVSPLMNQTGRSLGLLPVMRFMSEVSAIHAYPAGSPVGYSETWCSNQPSVIGIVPVGYADGYPRVIKPNTPIWVNGSVAPIVGRVSMDMLTVDLTRCSNVKIGDPVELWGEHIPVETIATSAGTIPYELLTKVTPRARCPL